MTGAAAALLEVAVTVARVTLTVLAELAAVMHRASRRTHRATTAVACRRTRDRVVAVIDWGSGRLSHAEDHLEDLQRATPAPAPALPGVLRLCAQGFHAPIDGTGCCPDCHQPLDPLDAVS